MFQIFAPGPGVVGWITGYVLHLFTHQIDLVFWFGQISIPTGIEDVAEACEHFDRDNIKFGITTETHGAFTAPMAFVVDTENEVPQALLSVSGTSPWKALEA